MPGTSAVLTPFCKTDGLYFNGENDPESFKYNFDKDIMETISDNGDLPIKVTPSFNSVEEYFDYHLRTNDVDKTFNISTIENLDNYMVIDVNIPD